jgi:MoxR-like ATPase
VYLGSVRDTPRGFIRERERERERDMGAKQTPDSTSGTAKDWGKSEEAIAKASDSVTTSRVHGPASPAIKDAFAAAGVTLPSAARAAEAPSLTPADQELRALQERDSLGGLKARAQCNLSLSKLDQLHLKTLRDPLTPAGTKQDCFRLLRDLAGKVTTTYHDAISTSPDAHLAAHVADLRKLRRDYDRGRIVKVPYVADKIKEITECLAAGNVVFMSGETGIGKTEVAKLAATAFSGQEPLLVRGYAGMSADELYGHMALTTDKTKQIGAIKKDIADAIKVFRETAADVGPEQETALVQDILSKSSATISTYVLGAVYKAAQQGRIVIIDEANYIPPDLIASLNDILTKRPGERINVQQDGVPPVEVKNGFGIIFTGNVNPPNGSQNERYIGRKPFDLALKDRITPVTYSYLPQTVEGTPGDFAPKDKQLFMVALTTVLLPAPQHDGQTLEKVESRHGTCLLPGGEKGLEKLWNLTKFAAVTQRAFAGEVKDGDPFGLMINGTSVGNKPSVALSPRVLMRVIEAWRNEGFQTELDYYVAKALFDRDDVGAKDKAHLYQIGKIAFGFFGSDGWDRDPDYNAATRGVFAFSLPKNESERAEIVPGRKVVESIYGEAPGRKEWPSEMAAATVAQQNETSEWISVSTDLEALLQNIGEVTGQVRGK